MKTGHDLASIFVLDYASPLVLISFAAIILIFISKVFTMTMRKWGYVISKNEIVVDEDLPNFYQAVPLSESDWILAENRNLREVYGFNMMQREIEKKLDSQLESKKYI